MPVVPTYDRFEQAYTTKFEAVLDRHGLIVRYENDRAALDLGLHLYDPARAPGTLGQVRVWFQLKGLTAERLPQAALRDVDTVAVTNLSMDHIQYWYAQPEPMYLAVYVEALDAFLAADIRNLVDLRGGVQWLRRASTDGQVTATLHVRLVDTLDEALRRMPRHRSMRLDGPEFRGRPLGHRFDPLRSQLDVMPPALFVAVVERLLGAHGFVRERELDPALFGDIGVVSASSGRLHSRYEWTSPLLTQFGFDEHDPYRDESQPFHHQGDALVVIHSDVKDRPASSGRLADELTRLHNAGLEQGLVFFNASDGDAETVGSWRISALRPLVVQWPQGLGSLAYNVLTATNVYLEFADRLPWRLINIQ